MHNYTRRHLTVNTVGFFITRELHCWRNSDEADRVYDCSATSNNELQVDFAELQKGLTQSAETTNVINASSVAKIRSFLT